MKFISPKTFVAAALLGVTVFSAAAYGATDPDKVKVLTRADFDALLAHPEQLTVIDLRRPDELTAIGGFPVYLSIQANDLASKLAWIPKDRTVVTVSNHAARGKKGAAALIDAGFKVAGAIGAQGYEEEGGKLTKLAPPAPKPEAASKK